MEATLIFLFVIGGVIAVIFFAKNSKPSDPVDDVGPIFLDNWVRSIGRLIDNDQTEVLRRFLVICKRNNLEPNDALNQILLSPYRRPGYDVLQHDRNLQAVLDYEVEQKEWERTRPERERQEAYRRMEERARLKPQYEAEAEAALRNARTTLETFIHEHLAVPEQSTDSVTLGTVPIIFLIRNPGKIIADLVFLLTTTKIEQKSFNEHDYPFTQSIFAFPEAPEIFKNLAIAAAETKSKDEYFKPAQANLPALTIATLCFRNTPYMELFTAPAPITIPPRKRFEHWHILAKTGHGKTQTLHNIIFQDITSHNPPSLIIIEPKGDIIEPLSRLKIFQEHPERLSIIDPIKKPALNFFDLPERIRKYPPDTRSLVIGKIAEAYSQALASADTEISPPQRNALNNVVRLVFAINGNLRDLLDVLDDEPTKSKDASAFESSRFRPQIEQLDEWTIRFFRTQFYEGQFRISRRSLSSKLQNIIGSFPPFGDIFGALENKLDLYQAMETPGSVVLINTNKGILGDYASSLFGRLMVAQTMSAALQRGFLKSNKNPTYLIVDEAQDYFDESFQTILEQTRSVNVGLIFAHHTLSQIARFRSIALGMPSIKLAAPELDDLDTMAAAMNAAPDLLSNLPTGNFGLAVRGQPTLPLRVQFGTLKSQPQMTDEQHHQLLADNARRFRPSEKPHTQPSSSAPQSTPQSAPQPTTRSIKFTADTRGHVYLNVYADDFPIRMLVDTGATNISLSPADAAKIGFDTNRLVYSEAIQTASGLSSAARIKLQTLRIDDFEIRDVDAHVRKSGADSLLGQEFLRRLASYEMRDGVLTFTWHETKPSSKPSQGPSPKPSGPQQLPDDEI